MNRAVVLLSGGLDSSTVMAIARSKGFECYALTIEYGQRHEAELKAATRVAKRFRASEHKFSKVDLTQFGGSALTINAIPVPKNRPIAEIGAPGDIPITYVPARNTVMLSLALAWAETIDAHDIFLGVNVLDASGYPDCSVEFVEAFERLANVATRAGTSGQQIRIHAPLIRLTKAEIIQQGIHLGVDYSETHSCYDPIRDAACSRCDACQLRQKGFAEAGVTDCTRYAC